MMIDEMQDFVVYYNAVIELIMVKLGVRVARVRIRAGNQTNVK